MSYLKTKQRNADDGANGANGLRYCTAALKLFLRRAARSIKTRKPPGSSVLPGPDCVFKSHLCVLLKLFNFQAKKKLLLCYCLLTLPWYNGVNMTPTSFAVIPCHQYYPNPITIILYFFYSSLMRIPTAANLFPLLFFSENFALYWLGSCWPHGTIWETKLCSCFTYYLLISLAKTCSKSNQWPEKCWFVFSLSKIQEQKVQVSLL